MICCICGKEIGESLARKWPVCKDPKCGREIDKLKSAKSQADYKKRIRADTQERRAKIAKLKKELPDKDTFAIKYATLKTNQAMAKEYKLLGADITQYRIELFGELPPKEVQKLGRELANPRKEIELKRVPIIVKVYNVKNLEAYREGLKQNKHIEDSNLEFERTELANEIALCNKSEILLEV